MDNQETNEDEPNPSKDTNSSYSSSSEDSFIEPLPQSASKRNHQLSRRRNSSPMRSRCTESEDEIKKELNQLKEIAET